MEYQFIMTFLDDTEYAELAACAEDLEKRHPGGYRLDLNPDRLRIVLTGERKYLNMPAARLCAVATEDAWDWTAAMKRTVPTTHEVIAEAERFLNGKG